jgi:ABC-type microcin C transport system duplicated ATPase subunit YejF
VVAGRSVQLISHRLSILRQADYICMMEHGRIVEEGTHEELLRKGAKYHDLFMAQARAYRLDADPTAAYDARAAQASTAGPPMRSSGSRT